MAAPTLGRRARWAPGPTASIDWSHPLSVGLFMCVVGGVSRVGQPTVDTMTRTPSKLGSAMRGASNSNYMSFVGFQTGPWTHVGLVELANWQSSFITMAEAPSNATGDRYLGIDSSGAVLGGIFDVGVKTSKTANAYAAGRRVFGAVTCDGATLATYAGSGDDVIIAATTTAVVNVGYALYVTPELVVGAQGVSGATGSTTLGNNSNPMMLAATWRRALSPMEVAMLATDPYCFLRV